MATFRVDVIETIRHYGFVNANSEAEAYDKVKKELSFNGTGAFNSESDTDGFFVQIGETDDHDCDEEDVHIH